ncbi:MAG TPA: threonine/serine dehydratase [Dehalococcoidia bacterium]|nr:threonine/serine dehydratase [Dehalococcoidia bacterium]
MTGMETALSLPRLDEIEAAAARLAPYVRRTPSLPLRPTYGALPGELWLKLESLQHTGSFKPRGAFNKLLSVEEPRRKAGVVAVSGGNHGLGVAFAAHRLGVPATIFLPVYASPVKQQRIAALGAEIVLNETIAEAFARADERVAAAGAVPVHPYADPLVICGQGTVGLEFVRDAPPLDVLYVAVGGGGLLAGVSIAAKAQLPGIHIVGVEPEGAATLTAARQAGRPVTLPKIGSVAADSLGAPDVAPLTFAAAQQHVDEVVLVNDDEIVAARARLWLELNLAAENGGAAAFAGYLSGRAAREGSCGVIVCGGNIDLGW